MRWQPQQDPCPECGFSWSTTRTKALDSVRLSTSLYEAVLASVALDAGGMLNVHAPVRPGLWSPLQYLWHMVDVVRIGTERLWTLFLEPEAGVPCWVENDLARVRKYDQLSLQAGLQVYRQAVDDWLVAAEDVPDGAETQHPEFGTATALDVIRRNAHEVQHHLMDIRQRVQSGG